KRRNPFKNGRGIERAQRTSKENHRNVLSSEAKLPANYGADRLQFHAGKESYSEWQAEYETNFIRQKKKGQTMSASKKNNPSGKKPLANQKIEDYLEGRLSPKEQWEIELWLSEEGLESDALEGLRQMSPQESKDS